MGYHIQLPNNVEIYSIFMSKCRICEMKSNLPSHFFRNVLKTAFGTPGLIPSCKIGFQIKSTPNLILAFPRSGLTNGIWKWSTVHEVLNISETRFKQGGLFNK